MSGILADLDYFDFFRGQVATRNNELARLSAMRELVAVAKALVCEPEFSQLPEKRRAEVGDVVLFYTAQLFERDPLYGATTRHCDMNEQLEVVHGQMLIRDEAFKARLDSASYKEKQNGAA